MPNDIKRKGGKIYYEKDNIKGSADKSWYRGKHCNFNPNKVNLKDADAASKYILKGWVPAKPFLTKKTPVIAFGSCFAEHITGYLSAKGYTIASDQGRGIIDFRAGVNNTFAVRQLFEWVYDGKVFAEETWHDSSKNIITRNKKIRNETLKAFGIAKIFIITLGLSEVWYNKQTGGVFWRAIPESQFDPNIHAFKVSTFAENKSNIQYIYDTIKKYNPKSKIIFTISPVPLVATFRPESCITANCVSKSILRAAVDEFYRENNGSNNRQLFYWPSYEIVKELHRDPYAGDNRHIKKECVKAIMKEFERFYTVK